MDAVKGKSRHVTYKRLLPQVRREQLLDTGAAMFAKKPYDDVFVEDIATHVGVSRALFYHYFSGKRELYVAMFERASSRFLARVSRDPGLPLAAHLAIAVEAHIQSFIDHPFESVTISRGADDPAIQAIVAEELSVVGQPLIDQLVADGRPPEATEIAVESWLAFVRAACVKWIESQNISRVDLTEMCLRAFGCALDIPIAPGGLRARISGVMQSPAVSSLIRKPQPELLPGVPSAAVSHGTTKLIASSPARSAFTSRRRP